MAANLSRNGPALQEAYVRVVTEKSPTDWWAAGRARSGWGALSTGGAAAGGVRLTCLPAPHPSFVLSYPFHRCPP